MKFSPSAVIGSSRQGTIQNITEQEIESIFGFPANVDDDPFKVVNSWAVDVDDTRAAILTVNSLRRAARLCSSRFSVTVMWRIVAGAGRIVTIDLLTFGHGPVIL